MLETMKHTRFKKIIAFALLIGALPYIFNISTATAYYTDVMIFVGIHSIISCGLSLLLGYTGQISLGQAAFYGVGAYTSGILTTSLQWNPWLAMASGMVLAAVLAIIIGVPSLRLKGHYLAMATLGFGMIVHIFLNEFIALTGGPSGFGGIPPLSIPGMTIDSTLSFYYVTWLAAVAVLLISLNIVDSRPGRALKAIHGSERAAAAMGIDIARAKVDIFVVSGIFGALAGSLYAHFVTFVNPPPFNVFFSLKVLMMVVIGGIGSVWGAFLGAALLTFLPEWLSSLQDLDVLAYGVILLLIVIFAPDGVAGLVERAASHVMRISRKI